MRETRRVDKTPAVMTMVDLLMNGTSALATPDGRLEPLEDSHMRRIETRERLGQHAGYRRPTPLVVVVQMLAVALLPKFHRRDAC